MSYYQLVNGETLDRDLTAVANTIRAKTGNNTKLFFPTGFIGEINGIQQGGGDDLLQYATFEGSYPFYYAKFPDGYEVKFKIAGTNPAFNYLFFGSNAQKISIESTGQLKKVVAVSTFLSCTQLTTVKFVNEPFPIGNGVSTFNGCSSLKTIEGTIDLSQSISNNNMFSGCNSLEEVRFTKESIKLPISFHKSPFLSMDSIESIIDALADYSGTDTSPVLTISGTTNAILTEEKVSEITNKNWTVAVRY